jgi:replicative DNA helicase
MTEGLHNHEAEAGLLGSILLEPKLLASIGDLLTSSDFHSERHAIIYAAIRHVRQSAKELTMVGLNQYLKDEDTLDRVGGLTYLMELAEAGNTSATIVDDYARQVKEKSQKRELRRIIDEERKRVGSAVGFAEQLEGMIASLLAMETGNATAEVAKVGDAAYDCLTVARERSLSRVSVSGVSLGTPQLDEATDGLQPGEMTVVGARPSMGKTMYALWVAKIAAMAGTPSLVFSLEMSRRALAHRLLSDLTGINSGDLRRSSVLSDSEWTQFEDAVGMFNDVPLLICDDSALTIGKMATVARRMKAQHDIGFIVIDYLQLMSPPKAGSREQEVSMMSAAVKRLARELNIPVMLLSQLNRGNEHREDKRPKLSDLRDSGSIEQDADVVLLLHREEYYHKGDEKWLDTPEGQKYHNVAEVIIAKQRNGAMGHFPLAFDAKCSRFGELDKRHPAWR